MRDSRCVGLRGVGRLRVHAHLPGVAVTDRGKPSQHRTTARAWAIGCAALIAYDCTDTDPSCAANRRLQHPDAWAARGGGCPLAGLFSRAPVMTCSQVKNGAAEGRDQDAPGWT